MDVTPVTPNSLGTTLALASASLIGQLLESHADGLSALAGGGQASATPIAAMISRFTTVATIADSAILTKNPPGTSMVVINAGAESMDVYPDAGSAINGGSANAPVALAAGKTAVFYTTIAGTWYMLLSA
jgi:hypothetical protein